MTENNARIYRLIVQELQENGHADADMDLVHETHKRDTSGGVVARNKKEADTHDLLKRWNDEMDSYFD